MKDTIINVCLVALVIILLYAGFGCQSAESKLTATFPGTYLINSQGDKLHIVKTSNGYKYVLEENTVIGKYKYWKENK